VGGLIQSVEGLRQRLRFPKKGGTLLKMVTYTQVWWYKPAIQALGKRRQED
jgi:hypothetical protein